MPPNADFLKEKAKFIIECFKTLASLILLIVSATTATLVKIAIDTAKQPDVTAIVNDELILLAICVTIGMILATAFVLIGVRLLYRADDLINSLRN